MRVFLLSLGQVVVVDELVPRLAFHLILAVTKVILAPDNAKKHNI